MTSDVPRPGTWRGRLDALMSPLSVSPLDALHQLVGGNHLWWQACGEALRTDPGWLDGPSARRALTYIAAKVDRDEQHVAESAAFVHEISRALASADAGRTERMADDLTRAVARWRAGRGEVPVPAGGALLNYRVLAVVPGNRAQAVEKVVAFVHRTGDVDVAPVIALTSLLLTGVPRIRHTTKVSVVFARRAGGRGHGVSGTLQLWAVAAGPAGLFPDPQTMGIVHADPAFWAAITGAWQSASDARRARCVVWRITVDGSSHVPALEGGSLGAAFAIGMNDLLRYPDRRGPSVALVRNFFHGLRRRAAVTGAVEPDGRLLPVGDVAEKFELAHRKGWRLVAPDGNRGSLGEVDPGAVRFAVTVREADRYARQWRAGRLVAAATTVLLLVAAVIGVRLYDAASSNRATLASRLAAASKSLLGTRIDLAQVFAAGAYREEATPVTKAALFAAVATNPPFVRAFEASGAISTITTDAAGLTAIAGTGDGTVMAWTLADGARTTVAHLGSPIRSVAADAHAGVIAAADAAEAVVWTPSQGTRRLAIPGGWNPVLVGVSPSGHSVMVVATRAQDSSRELLYFGSSGGPPASLPVTSFYAPPSNIAVPSDSEAVLFDGAYGSWERVSLPALSPTGGSEVGFGIHDAAAALSADGSHFTYTNRGDRLPVWSATGAPDVDRPARTLAVAGQDPVALALSADGSHAASPDANGTIYVSSGSTRPTALAGTPAVTGGLAFAGPLQNQLLSASGNLLYLWNLSQRSRIEIQGPAVIDGSCNGCDGPEMAISPDDDEIAVVNGDGTTLGTFNFAESRAAPAYVRLNALSDVKFGPPLWRAPLTVIALSDGAPQVDTTSGSRVRYMTWPPTPNPLQLPDPASSVVMSPDRRTVVELDASGTIVTRDAGTGEVERRIDGPRDMAPTADGVSPIRRPFVASSADLIAFADVDAQTVIVTKLDSGRQVSYPAPGLTGVGLLGHNLLIQRRNDDLEVWDTSGKRIKTLRADANVYGLATNNTDMIAALGPDGTISVTDFPSGSPIGSVSVDTAAPSKATSLAFSADGRYLFTASEYGGDKLGSPGVVTRWDMRPSAWADAACRSAGRMVTAAEWAQYVGIGNPSSTICGG